MLVKTASPCNGFDVNQQLLPGEALAFKNAGYDFCIRYLPRAADLIAGNLTNIELEKVLLEEGLCVMAVQHCPEPGWSPSDPLGSKYGNFAAQYAESIGYPKGASIYLDLETPSSAATAQDCIDYVHSWVAAVESVGYLAALYIGYGVPLTPKQLYDLPVKSYWSAYNYDDGVATRGFQIVQHIQKTLNEITFDPNTIKVDDLGDLPIWVSP
jgi:hypothetical protein